MVKTMMAGAIAAAVVGCGPPAQAPNVYVNTQATAAASVGGGAAVDVSDDTGDEGPPGATAPVTTAPVTTVPVATGPMMTPAARSVIVLVDKYVDRPTELLGVFDFHSAATSEDKGFDELRAHAAAIGADAVIGAEFEHGDDGGPSHLSGMAVRFLDH
jgi:hypothetical protein